MIYSTERRNHMKWTNKNQTGSQDKNLQKSSKHSGYLHVIQNTKKIYLLQKYSIKIVMKYFDE